MTPGPKNYSTPCHPPRPPHGQGFPSPGSKTHDDLVAGRGRPDGWAVYLPRLPLRKNRGVPIGLASAPAECGQPRGQRGPQ
jgi:hypothetical protein